MSRWTHRSGVARGGARVAAAVALAVPVLVLAALQGAGAAPSPTRPPLTARIPPPLPPGAHRGAATDRDPRPTTGPSTTPPGTTSPWQPLVNQFPGNPAAMQLLTDGTVLVQGLCSGSWLKLTPDASGSYLDGTWTTVAPMPNGYSPLYDASAVLPDGRLLVEGGEYGSDCQTQAELNEGAIYNPVANKWTPVAPPSGWASIGDAPSTVLANGRFLLGQIAGSSSALFDAANLTWSTTGAGKVDAFAEEGLSLLPNDDVLTVDTTVSKGSELYSPASGAWSSAGTTPTAMSTGEELGPQLLLPSGDVVAFGASGPNAYYDPSAAHGVNAWTAAPSFPVVGSQQYAAADAPAAVLPDGDVLVASSPFNGSSWSEPTHYFDLHGSTITQAVDSPNAANEFSYDVRMLVLPTGQVLVNDSGTLELYTDPNAALAGLAPGGVAVSSTTLSPGATATVSGTQLNGVTQASAYGDDYQDATNFPLVKVVNDLTKIVTFARTSAMTSMSVTPGLSSSAHFTMPATTPLGPSELYVGANGNWSAPTPVSVLYPTTTAFESAAGDLGLWRSEAGTMLTHLVVAKATSPSAATAHGGVVAVAFQSGAGDLELTRSPGATTDTRERMAKGTSPSAVVLRNGSVAVAFQSSAGVLEVWHSSGTVQSTHDEMHPGTSPSLAELRSGALAVAYQSAGGVLTTWLSAARSVDTHQVMEQGTSPSLTALSNGTWVIAFASRSATLELWRSTGGVTSAHVAMRRATNPSIAVQPAATVAVAVQTSAGDLEVWRSTGSALHTSDVVRAATSPSLLTLPNGTFEVAYESAGGDLTSWVSLGVGPSTTQVVATATSPSLT